MNVLFLIVFIDMLGFGLILPLLPFFADRAGAGDAMIGIIIASYSVGQLVGGPIWGRLSDTYGRKPILVISSIGAVLSYLLLGVADSVWLLLFARAFGGLMAGNISAAFAYATDMSDPANRAKTMGRVSAAFSFGFFIGPMLGGLLAGGDLETANFFLTSIVAAVFAGVAVISAAVFLKESLDQDKRKPLNAKRQGDVMQSLRMFADRRQLMSLFLISFLLMNAGSVIPAMLSVWANVTLALQPNIIGLLYAYIALFSIIMQGGVVGPVVKKIGEHRTLRGAITFYAAGLILLAFTANIYVLIFALTILGMGFGVLTPTLNSLVSQQAAATERGAIIGIQQAVQSFARITGPIIAWMVYDIYQGGSAFAAAALLVLPGAALAFAFTRPAPETPPASAS